MPLDPDFDCEPLRRSEERPNRRVLRAAIVAAIGLSWSVDRPLAFAAMGVAAAACLVTVCQDVRDGSLLARAGARIDALFRWAWAAWKVGALGVALLVGLVVSAGPRDLPSSNPVERSLRLSAAGVVALGFAASFALTALGATAALRSGRRVWIGGRANRVVILIFTLFATTFYGAIILEVFVCMVVGPTATPPSWFNVLLYLALAAIPLAIAATGERVGRLVPAAGPAKPGAEAPGAGKWDP